MALDTIDFKSDARVQTGDNAAHHLANNANSGDLAMAKSTAMPAAFAPNGNDLTIVDDKLAKSMKAAEAMLSPEAKARVEAQADLPYRFIKAAGDYHEPKAIVAEKGVTYWLIAETLLASRGHTRAGVQEINGMVKDIAAANGKTMQQANNLKAGEIIKLPHR